MLGVDAAVGQTLHAHYVPVNNVPWGVKGEHHTTEGEFSMRQPSRAKPTSTAKRGQKQQRAGGRREEM